MGFLQLLREVRREQRRALWTQGILYALVALGMNALLGASLGRIWPSVTTPFFVLGPVTAVALLGYFGLFRARRDVGDEARTARLVGERIPTVSLDLLAAVELEQALGKTQQRFSAELAEAFLVRTSERARSLSATEVVDPRPLQWAKRALWATVALLAAVSYFSPRGFWTVPFQRAQGTSAAELAALREPITGEVELTYHFPAYTGLPPRTDPGTNGEITAPIGTEVLLKTRADRDVHRAELALPDGANVPLQVKGTRDLSGSLIVKKTGTYAFVFRDARGHEVARGPDVALTAQADAAPKVTLLLPAAELEVDPKQDVTLKYEATDDYGITQLALVYRVGGKEEARVALPHGDERRVNGQYVWQLAGLHLAAGDRISYFLEARDNSLVTGGAQKGVSRTQVLRVYSASEHRREQLELVERLWEKLIKQLADRMEGPDRAASPTNELFTGPDGKAYPNHSVTSGRQNQPDIKAIIAQSSVDAAGSQLAADLLATAKTLNKQRDKPLPIIAGLLNIHDGYWKALQRTISARGVLARFSDARPADFSPRVAHVVNEEISELEKDILYLESLLDRQKLEELKDITKKLAEDRRELTSLIEEFQRTKSEKSKEALLAQAETLKRDIQQLLQRMAELSKGTHDEHINMEALQEMAKQQSLSQDLDAAEKALREGKTEEALAKLSQLASKVDEMQKSLDRAQKNQGKANPELVRKFKDFAQELKATAEQQRKVADSTRAIRDRYKERMKERLKQRGGALKDQLKKDVEALQKDYQKNELHNLSVHADDARERMLEELDNLHSALGAEDFDLAAESADRAQRVSNELEQFAEQQERMDQLYQNPPDVQQHAREVAQRFAQDSRKTQEINRKLQQLFPPPGSMMSDEDKQKLQSLQQQQRELGQKTQGLQQKMQDINQLAPVFGEDGPQRLESVGERMGEAEQRLGSRDPGRGYGEQKAALDGLDQLQQQMSQGQQGSGSGGLPMPMMAGGGSGDGQDQDGQDLSHEKVEIPDADPNQAPQAFRKDLMDAMKQGTPEKYKEQVKKYYEELVK